MCNCLKQQELRKSAVNHAAVKEGQQSQSRFTPFLNIPDSRSSKPRNRDFAAATYECTFARLKHCPSSGTGQGLQQTLPWHPCPHNNRHTMLLPFVTKPCPHLPGWPNLQQWLGHGPIGSAKLCTHTATSYTGGKADMHSSAAAVQGRSSVTCGTNLKCAQLTQQATVVDHGLQQLCNLRRSQLPSNHCPSLST